MGEPLFQAVLPLIDTRFVALSIDTPLRTCKILILDSSIFISKR